MGEAVYGRILKGGLVLLLALLGACGSGLLQENEHILPAGTPMGSVVGQVRDASTGLPLAGVQVTLVRDGKDVVAGQSNASGLVQFRIQAETAYQLRYEHTGFSPVRYAQVRAAVDDLRSLETILMTPLGGGEGQLQATIHSAVDAKVLPEVALMLRAGVNNADGEPLLIEATDSGGGYFFSGLPAGSYTLELQAEGFAPTYQTLVIQGGISAWQRYWMSPDDLLQGQARVVLNWRDARQDLDAFLSGPQGSGNGNFMIYYSQFNADGANLLLQSQAAENTESIEIRQHYPGSYYFAVDDFKAREDVLLSAQADAMAKVELYRNNERRDVFYPPLTRRGVCWTVFELTQTQLKALNRFDPQTCKNSLQALP